MNNPYTLTVGPDNFVAIKRGDTGTRIQMELHDPNDSSPVLTPDKIDSINVYVENKKDVTRPYVLKGDIDDINGIVGFNLTDYSKVPDDGEYALEVVIHYASVTGWESFGNSTVGVYSSSSEFSLVIKPSLVRGTYK